MASPTVTFSITAPGFWGLNTQDSPVDMDPKFSLDARNCVIDKFGRLAARKGWEKHHGTSAGLGSANVECIGELISGSGSLTTLCAGNNKLFKVTAGTPNTLTELTYGGGGIAPVITASKWQQCQLNGAMLFWQRGYDCLIFDPAISSTNYRRLSEHASYTGSAPQANCGISAYGRIWAADTSSDKNTVYWSDTLTYMKWTGGTSGSLNLHGVWPQGGDEIVALAAHNDRLVIFGRKQILIYVGADNPLEMRLEDAISGVGCFGRDSVANTPTDLLFLSDLGVYSIKRTIQEKSAPTATISKNVNNDIQSYIANEASGATVKSVYSPIDSFYLLTFSGSGVTFCFDTRSSLPDGSLRCTFWYGINPKAYCYSNEQVLRMGFAGYIGNHSSYRDDQSTYRLFYYTPWVDLGDPSRESILKKIAMTFYGLLNNTLVFKWDFDYKSGSQGKPTLNDISVPSEYNVSEYNIDEYGGDIVFSVVKANASGSGKVLKIGAEIQIDGYPISIQKMDIYTKNGAYK